MPSLDKLVEAIKPAISLKDKELEIVDKDKLRETVIDNLVYNLALNDNKDIKSACQWLIWEAARILEIYPASIQEFYLARGKGGYSGLTVPAINIRGMTYEAARTLVRTAVKNKSLAFIFEIAKSEIGYTFQKPAEYAAVCLAAAIKEGFVGPLFIQGDHFQAKAKNYQENPQKEVNSLRDLIKQAIDAGFYNIDIDSSTLVDLNQPTIEKQQENNFGVAAQLTAFIRRNQPQGVVISVGGEIGEVGGKNSTTEELHAFMQGYKKELREHGEADGISKISVQTGTAHGGVVLPDGSVARVKLDFDTLKTLSEIGREDYAMAGAVQHGASTLPDEAFHRFPEVETAEVHLATGFQNIIYESKHFPDKLRNKIYSWLKENCAGDKKDDQTEEQFIYKTRKKGFGPFKKEIADLPGEVKTAISQELEEKFDFLFKQLNVVNTEEMILKYIEPKAIRKEMPASFISAL